MFKHIWTYIPDGGGRWRAGSRSRALHAWFHCVCVRVCVCVCVCVCLFMYASVCANVYIYTCRNIYICVRVCV